MKLAGADDPPKPMFILVPGFWLGAWAWAKVAGPLRAAGHDVEAVTLPGLAERAAPRAGVTLADHVAAVAALVAQRGPGVILVGHSGAGSVIYAVTDRLPDQVRRAVYVDSGPLPDGTAISPHLGPDVTEIPLPAWAELEAAGTSLVGLGRQRRADFRRQAVPHPAGPARDRLRLTGTRRRDVPVTMITSSYRPADVARLARQGHPYFAELTELPVSYIDLPTGHWPMLSRPAALAAALLQTAAA
jgi:pimeloyl-ACP methyl ester carboxylesterase